MITGAEKIAACLQASQWNLVFRDSAKEKFSLVMITDLSRFSLTHDLF